jgi:hypothetical protein
LLLSADPASALEAATKQYVDAHTGGGGSVQTTMPTMGTYNVFYTSDPSTFSGGIVTGHSFTDAVTILNYGYQFTNMSSVAENLIDHSQDNSLNDDFVVRFQLPESVDIRLYAKNQDFHAFVPNKRPMAFDPLSQFPMPIRVVPGFSTSPIDFHSTLGTIYHDDAIYDASNVIYFYAPYDMYGAPNAGFQNASFTLRYVIERPTPDDSTLDISFTQGVYVEGVDFQSISSSEPGRAPIGNFVNITGPYTHIEWTITQHGFWEIQSGDTVETFNAYPFGDSWNVPDSALSQDMVIMTRLNSGPAASPEQQRRMFSPAHYITTSVDETTTTELSLKGSARAFKVQATVFGPAGTGVAYATAVVVFDSHNLPPQQ